MVTKLFHKHIFAYLRTQGIMYLLERDFNGKGGFQAYWLNIYGLGQVFRKDLGNNSFYCTTCVFNVCIHTNIRLPFTSSCTTHIPCIYSFITSTTCLLCTYSYVTTANTNIFLYNGYSCNNLLLTYPLLSLFIEF